MLEMCRHYSISPLEITSYNTMLLSQMYSAMISSKALDRLHRIEELACRYMKEKDRDRFLDILYKAVDDKYKDSRSVGEDELKRILHGFR